MIAIILNYPLPLYPFCFNNRTGDRSIPSVFGRIPFEVLEEFYN